MRVLRILLVLLFLGSSASASIVGSWDSGYLIFLSNGTITNYYSTSPWGTWIKQGNVYIVTYTADGHIRKFKLDSTERHIYEWVEGYDNGNPTPYWSWVYVGDRVKSERYIYWENQINALIGERLSSSYSEREFIRSRIANLKKIYKLTRDFPKPILQSRTIDDGTKQGRFFVSPEAYNVVGYLERATNVIFAAGSVLGWYKHADAINTTGEARYVLKTAFKLAGLPSSFKFTSLLLYFGKKVAQWQWDDTWSPWAEASKDYRDCMKLRNDAIAYARKIPAIYKAMQEDIQTLKEVDILLIQKYISLIDADSLLEASEKNAIKEYLDTQTGELDL